MARVLQENNGEWMVQDENGIIVASGVTNAKAWRIADNISGEATSLIQLQKEIKDCPQIPTQDEMQEFISGLIQVGMDRGYARGWAWHKFCEKYGHTPEGLHRIPCKPSKRVWGWLNRKAIRRNAT